MDTRQLMTFTTLAETLNYQRAAERLQYAPSSLFRHVQQLEEELGATLFFKNGRQLELTATGQRLLPDAKRLLAGYQDFLTAARQAETDQALALGGCEMNTSYSLMELLQHFTAQFPDMRYSMTTSPNAAVPDLLRGGIIDIGFYYSTSSRRPQGLAHVPLYQEVLHPCVAPSNPLRDRKGLHWSDLDEMDVAHPHDNCCFITEYKDTMRASGLSVGRLTFLGGITLVAKHAQRENTLLLIPKHSLKRFGEDFGIVPLDMDEKPLWFWESVLYRNSEELTSSARRLIRFCAEYARSQLAGYPEFFKGPASFDPYLSQL